MTQVGEVILWHDKTREKDINGQRWRVWGARGAGSNLEGWPWYSHACSQQVVGTSWGAISFMSCHERSPCYMLHSIGLVQSASRCRYLNLTKWMLAWNFSKFRCTVHWSIWRRQSAGRSTRITSSLTKPRRRKLSEAFGRTQHSPVTMNWSYSKFSQCDKRVCETLMIQLPSTMGAACGFKAGL